MGPSGGSSGSRGWGLGFQELFAKFQLYFQGPWSHRNLEGPEAVPGIECIREREPRAVGTREGHHLGCVQKESTGDAASDVTRSMPRPFWTHSTGKAPKKV